MEMSAKKRVVVVCEPWGEFGPIVVESEGAI